jgi:membrane protein
VNFEIEKAFCFIKNDSDWLKKLLIGAGINLGAFLSMLICVFAVLFTRAFNVGGFLIAVLPCALFLVAALGVYGFTLQYGQDRIRNENAPLPEWKDFSSFLFTGFKACLGAWLYFIPVFALAGLSFIVQVSAKVHGGADSYTIASLVVNSLYNLFYLIFLVFYFVFNASFLKDFNVFSFINIAKAYRMLKGCWKQYFTALLLILAVGVVLNIASIILVLTIIGVILIPFVFLYFQIVMMDITAQFVRIEEESKRTTVEE